MFIYIRMQAFVLLFFLVELKTAYIYATSVMQHNASCECLFVCLFVCAALSKRKPLRMK